VPGAYQPLTPVEAGIHKVTITAALLGTNSYMYVPAPS
jgi:hypothetical protein